MNTQNSIPVRVEASPIIDVDQSHVDLNCGSFLLECRIPRNVWSAIKQADACYYLSAEEIEDMDLFGTEPGWRYSLHALKILLVDFDYMLNIREQHIVSLKQLLSLFTKDANDAYKAEQQRIQQQREQLKEEHRAKKEQQRIQQQREYKVWKNTHIKRLVETTTSPDRETVTWLHVTQFGDHDWYTTLIDGVSIYKAYYGNVQITYAPQALVDRWIREQWEANTLRDGCISTAYWLLKRYQAGLNAYGDDVAARLIELDGLDHYIDLAATETVIVPPSAKEDIDVAAAFGLPIGILHVVDTTLAARRAIAKDIGVGTIAYVFEHPETHDFYIQETPYHPVKTVYTQHKDAVLSAIRRM